MRCSQDDLESPGMLGGQCRAHLVLTYGLNRPQYTTCAPGACTTKRFWEHASGRRAQLELRGGTLRAGEGWGASECRQGPMREMCARMLVPGTPRRRWYTHACKDMPAKAGRAAHVCMHCMCASVWPWVVHR